MALSFPKRNEGRVEGPKRLKQEKNMPAWLYILRLKSGQLCTGSTTDLDQRYKNHCSGRACRTTLSDPPQNLIYSEKHESFSDARKREAQIKRWTRAKKEALVSGNMIQLKSLAKSYQSRKKGKGSLPWACRKSWQESCCGVYPEFVEGPFLFILRQCLKIALSSEIQADTKHSVFTFIKSEQVNI